MNNRKLSITWIAFICLLICQVFLALLPFLPFTTGLLDSLISGTDTSNPHTFASIYLSTVGIHASLMMIFLGFAFASVRKDFKAQDINIERAICSHAHIQPLRDDHFYGDFQLAAERAQSRVFISYLAPTPPDDIDTNRKRYYRRILSVIKNNPTAQYRRIIRLTNDNLEWILSLVDKLKRFPNASIAILEDSGAEYMPLSMSTQIVDEQDTWLVAVESHERTGVHRDLHIQDSEFCAMLSLYYDRLWRKSTVLLDCGTIQDAALSELSAGKEST